MGVFAVGRLPADAKSMEIAMLFKDVDYYYMKPL